MFGFCFDDDDEAATFHAKVTDRTARPKRTYILMCCLCASYLHAILAGTTKGRTKPAKKDKALPPRPRCINTSTISAPTPASFVHVAHVGINAKGTIETSKDIDPAWGVLIQDLQEYGVSRDVVVENIDFVEGFLAGAKTKATGTDNDAVKTSAASDKRVSLASSIGFYRWFTFRSSI